MKVCARVVGVCLILMAVGFAFPSRADEPTATAPKDHARPNILMIMADDLGPEWLGCYGGVSVETPNIDALAASGVRFLNAYSMPKCTPTRVTLLTGTYPFRHGWAAHWDVPRWGARFHFDTNHYTTFAEILQQAGYRTAAAGKWQINDFRVQPDCMQRHGFEESCMWTGYETGVRESGRRYWDPYINTNGKSKSHEGKFGTDVFVDFLIDFMRRHHDEPFLAYFPMCLPHTPFTTTPLDENAAGKNGCQRAMVRYIDHSVGRLVKTLDDLDIRDNTIVLFFSDNGSTRGINTRVDGRQVSGGKDSLFETGVNMPFVVTGPDWVFPRGTTDELTDVTDILPTLAEFAGATLPHDLELDGTSIAPFLKNESDTTGRDWVLAMGHGTMVRTAQGVRGKSPPMDRVIRDKRYKLWQVHGKLSRLGDLKTDQSEGKNLITSDDQAALAAMKRLQKVLQSLPQDRPPRYNPTPPQDWDRPVKGE